jgi:type II secretory pathway pseudopilin PulG
MKNKTDYLKNNKGISLVEVMIALVVLLLVFIGLLQAALLSIDHNMRNLLREEAVKIVSQKTEEARSLPFDNVISNPGVCSITMNICRFDTDCATGETCVTPPTATISSCTAAPTYPMRIDRDFRNIQNFPFGMSMTVTDILDPDGITLNTKQIEIVVRWEYKNECYTQSITTVRRR